MTVKPKPKINLWHPRRGVALLTTLLLIVITRESCVWLMGLIHHPELGNLLGLLLLLSALLIWRKFRPIPVKLLDANAKIMKESAFAFLPVSAGSIIMLFHLGKELPWLFSIMVFSTLFALWLYARLAKSWLK